MKNEDSLTMSIGGISLLLKSNNHLILSQIKDIYSNFVIDSSDYSFKIELEVLKDKMINYNLDTPKVTIDENGELCTIIMNNFTGEFNLHNCEGKLRYNNHLDKHMELNNYLRIIYSLILLDEPGFLVHAASLINNESGFLFPGKSGTGKTTITRLSNDSILLSDEVSLVKMVNGKYNLFGTPFWGELAIAGENVDTPLKQILLPKKDKENYKKSVKPIKTLEHLIPNVLFFLHDDKHNMRLFNICLDFVNTIPAYELHFKLEPSFWSVINAK